MIHEDIQYCLGMVLAGEGDLDRGVKEKSSVIFPSPLKIKCKANIIHRMMSEIKVLHSLHRPYQCPLWIVKWICCFYEKRIHSAKGYLLYDDFMVDMYFCILGWLRKYYPEDCCAGIPSKDAINAVLDYFEQYNMECRTSMLKEILVKSIRSKGIEKQVYSTYKAVSYYNNLTKEKLHFVDTADKCIYWEYSSFKHFKYHFGIAKNDRAVFMRQVLIYDAHFFLSLILLHKYSKKYGLKVEDLVFEFLQKFYTIPRFDFVSQSHQNYYEVRRHWIEQLCAITKTGALSPILNRCIRENCQLYSLRNDILNNIKLYVGDLKKKSAYLKNSVLFYKSYKNNLNIQKDKSGFVNLYNICSDMKMNYAKFNAFISEFYESERLKKNIYFINIVSTIDQRKRFYIRKTPVLKIKIL